MEQGNIANVIIDKLIILNGVKQTMNNPLSFEECYLLLNLNPNSTITSLNKNYRQLVAKHHPDKCLNAEEKTKITEKLKRINCARDILKDYLNKFNQLPLFHNAKFRQKDKQKNSDNYSMQINSSNDKKSNQTFYRHNTTNKDNQTAFTNSTNHKPFDKPNYHNLNNDTKNLNQKNNLRKQNQLTVKIVSTKHNLFDKLCLFMQESPTKWAIATVLLFITNFAISFKLANWISVLFGADSQNADQTIGWGLVFLLTFIFLFRSFVVKYYQFKDVSLLTIKHINFHDRKEIGKRNS